MKNVYDYEIHNDTAEQETEVETEIIETKEVNVEKPKKVLYDKHGNVREDKTERRIKFIGIFIFVILLQIYVAQCIAKEMGVLGG